MIPTVHPRAAGLIPLGARLLEESYRIAHRARRYELAAKAPRITRHLPEPQEDQKPRAPRQRMGATAAIRFERKLEKFRKRMERRQMRRMGGIG